MNTGITRSVARLFWWWVPLLIHPGVYAQEGSLEPHARLQIEYLDNARMSTGRAESRTGGYVEMGMRLMAQSSRAQIQFQPQVRLFRYADVDEFDRDEGTLGFSGSRETMFGEWAVAGNYARDTTLTSEWEDTGFVGVRKWRRSRMLNPSWSGTWSESVQSRFSVGYSDVYYEGAADTPLVGYDNRWFDAALSRTFSERTTGTVSLFVSRLNAPRVANTAEDGGFRASITREWSHTLITTFTAGGHREHARTGAESVWRNGALLEARVSKEMRQGTWETGFTRSVEPSGYGVLLERDRLFTSVRREIAEDWSGTLALRLTQDRSLERSISASDRDLFNFEGRLTWQMTPRWMVASGVNYTRQKYRAANEAAGSASVVMQIGYHGPRFARSY